MKEECRLKAMDLAEERYRVQYYYLPQAIQLELYQKASRLVNERLQEQAERRIEDR